MKNRSRRQYWMAWGLVSVVCVSITASDVVDAPAGRESSVADAEEEVGGVGFLPDGVEAIPTVDEILAGDPNDESYREGETVNCIRLRLVRRIDSLDRHHALFFGRRGEVWLNKYRLRCNGTPMKSHRPMTESRGGSSSICRDDSIDWFDPMNGRFTMKINCRLGEFQQISEEQAEALKVSVEYKRKAEREQRRQARRARKAARRESN